MAVKLLLDVAVVPFTVTEGMFKKTVELVEKHEWYYTRQFEREANADISNCSEFGIPGDRNRRWLHGFAVSSIRARLGAGAHGSVERSNSELRGAGARTRCDASVIWSEPMTNGHGMIPKLSVFLASVAAISAIAYR